MAVQTLINRFTNDAHIASIHASNALVAKDKAGAQQAAADCRRIIAIVRTLPVEDAEGDALDLEQLDEIEKSLKGLGL